MPIAKGDDAILLVDNVVFNAGTTEYESEALDAAQWKHVSFFIEGRSYGEGSHSITFYAEYSPVDSGNHWFVCRGRLGELAVYESLSWQAAAIADQDHKCSYYSECLGKRMRVRFVATDTTATNKFKFSVKALLWS